MTNAAENNEVLSPEAQVTITGRNVEIPEHFADRVKSKLAKIEKLDPTLTFFHVELQHERNPRRESASDRIQITATGKGHIARAEAKEDSFYAALETALAKMQRSLRKVKARRTIARSGHRVPKSTGEIAAELNMETQNTAVETTAADPYADQVQDVLPGQIVRRKDHSAKPISIDQALSEMELVGHDFYLFVDEATGKPSVVYRRHAYDYGLIALSDEAAEN
ncbi:ribosome hibernation-promoting factor, HPF/YfiA family [Corynebacterium caspium]|uniref:ribosome hibernation-promoting factor, HPF/YfiA family n=1 Tax=Corynebacterium caspium TaxID=234828 RepID=UPI000364CDD5|nr:ribosome-associated translation inhibitor RaiA [Corynebacterium caspium]WKD59710.1 Ribosome-associated factor Y [Corynebacterium caspium DSM 44850]